MSKDIYKQNVRLQSLTDCRAAKIVIFCWELSLFLKPRHRGSNNFSLFFRGSSHPLILVIKQFYTFSVLQILFLSDRYTHCGFNLTTLRSSRTLAQPHWARSSQMLAQYHAASACLRCFLSFLAHQQLQSPGLSWWSMNKHRLVLAEGFRLALLNLE